MKNGLICPSCQRATQVVDSRPRGRSIKRRRKCFKCGAAFTTLEFAISLDDGPSVQWGIGEWVQSRGSEERWRGAIVGTYVTRGKRGYCVESYYEPGSVRNMLSHKLNDWTPPDPKGDLFDWTGEMLDALVLARSEGATYLDCADIIGVSINAIAKKCHELGINGKMNRGPHSGKEALAGGSNNGLR